MSSFALLHGLEGDGGTLELDDGVPDDEALLGQLVLVVVDRGVPLLLLLLLFLLAVFACKRVLICCKASVPESPTSLLLKSNEVRVEFRCKASANLSAPESPTPLPHKFRLVY